MSERITDAMLNQLVVNYGKAIFRLTGVTPELDFQRGSKINGVAYSLRSLVRDNTGRVVDSKRAWGTDYSHLGFTKREAYNLLSCIVRTISEAADHFGLS